MAGGENVEEMFERMGEKLGWFSQDNRHTDVKPLVSFFIADLLVKLEVRTFGQTKLGQED